MNFLKTFLKFLVAWFFLYWIYFSFFTIIKILIDLIVDFFYKNYILNNLTKILNFFSLEALKFIKKFEFIIFFLFSLISIHYYQKKFLGINLWYKSKSLLLLEILEVLFIFFIILFSSNLIIDIFLIRIFFYFIFKIIFKI